jgi:protein ImuB
LPTPAPCIRAIADWCDRYTPLVGLDAPDGLLLDVTGCAHLFNGEAALARDLVTRLTNQGLHARVAVADTVGCAWGIARYGKPGIVPRGETEAAVLPLPIAALRIDTDTVADLKTTGLVCVADLAARPRAPFAARFGKGLLLRLDQALGRVDEPITPRLPVPAAMAEQRFPDPIAREADVLGTIEHLARQLAGVLERRGEGGRLFQVALFRADGAVHRLEIGTGAPLRDPGRIRKLFKERLAVLGDACDPGFGYDMVRLSALVTERSDPAQTGLAGSDHAEELAHLIDRLGARFGLRNVTRLVPQDTHIPEYAVASVPAHAPRPAATSMPPIEQDSLSAARPLRLFTRPEPIDALAQVPDGPPIRFSWRHVTHQVAQAEGPERIAMEWWRDNCGNQLTRDYFRVEDSDGARMWLYREGLYDREVALPQMPRWYLHGLFA